MNEDRASAKHTDTRRRGSYGIDAPYLLPVPALLIVVNIVNGVISGTLWPFVAAVVVMTCGGFGLYASKRGKFVVWAELLDQLNLSGDERILDMGCGRGAILLLAAERLTTGRAVGVDLWRKGDQSGNAAEVTMSNAARWVQAGGGAYALLALLLFLRAMAGRPLVSL
jgi:arsenite methyltransferase